MKDKAFTLAEVLITLGIIGVVAALTLPSLINKYQKHVYYTQLMKAAASIENAFRLYNLDECGDGNGSCIDYTDLNGTRVDSISKYLNVITKNDSSIFEKYSFSELNKEQFWEAPAIGNDRNSFVITNDGILIYECQADFGDDIFIDTNGFKGPNIVGRDIFLFQTVTGKGIVWAGSEDYPANFEVCDNLHRGFTCAGRLLQEGKMNY